MANERVRMLACLSGQVEVVQVPDCPGVDLAIVMDNRTWLLSAAAAPIKTQLERAAASNDVVMVSGFWVGSQSCTTLHVHQVETPAAFARRLEAWARDLASPTTAPAALPPSPGTSEES